MKRIIKTTMIVFALVLILSVTIEGTLAYFSDHEQASGGATLNLGGKTELYEGEREDAKEVVISNTGKTNMIVRVGIFGPDEMQAPSYNRNLWEKIGDYYYYKKILAPGEDTSDAVITAEMKFKWEGEEPDYEFEVTVVHEGSQALYDDDALVVPDGWDEAGVAAIEIPEVTGKEGE